MIWAGHEAFTGDRRGAYRVFVVRSEGKRALGKPRRRWDDNIKIHLQEIKGGMDWIDLSQVTDRLRESVNAVMNLHFS
jgi:hypothetical protein